VWIVNARRSSNGEKAWSVIMITLFGLGVLILGYTCLQKFLRKQKIRQSDRELEENDEELRRM